LKRNKTVEAKPLYSTPTSMQFNPNIRAVSYAEQKKGMLAA
jgi:hypothetical protein